MKAELLLDALEQALWARGGSDGLIHHSVRGSQYLAIRYTERLAEAGIQCSVGTTGDSYDNARAESIIGLFKTEVSIAADRGSTSTGSNTRRSSGSTGTTPDGCSHQSATCRHRKRELVYFRQHGELVMTD